LPLLGDPQGDSLAGYITLLADKLQVENPILVEEGVKYQTFPAIKIGLLAVDSLRDATRTTR
jgi:hypothetical protein